MNRFALGCIVVLLVLLFVAVSVALAIGGSYNRLVRLQQAVDQSWAQVQNVYQRRADLIPNLVNTVSGAGTSTRRCKTTTWRCAVSRRISSRGRLVFRQDHSSPRSLARNGRRRYSLTLGHPLQRRLRRRRRLKVVPALAVAAGVSPATE